VPYTLLLADDSVTIQRVIELTFADEDVKVIAVSDGDQAIARLESSPPDIVLADIGMPGKNGYEVAKYVKQSPTLSHIPVVLLTGAFEPVDQARANEAGCDGVLAKPFEPQLVIGRVKDLLAKSARRTPAPRDDNLTPAAPPAADRWDAPLEPPGVKSAGAQAAVPLDDYFDRLDAAFQSLSGPAPIAASSKAASAPPADSVPDIDWFGATNESSAPASEPWDLPVPEQERSPAEAAELSLSYPSPPPAFDARASESTEAVVSVPFVEAVAEVPAEAVPPVSAQAVRDDAPAAAFVPPASAPPPQLPTINALPPLAEAFAAILAAEQHEHAASASAGWPGGSPSPDDLVEQVTRRVLDHLSDKVVRDAVSDIVSQIAERLVLEEIERIKASIR
jgi:CheY-like chemotaxis protein